MHQYQILSHFLECQVQFGPKMGTIGSHLLMRCSARFLFLLKSTGYFLESNMSSLDVIQGTYAAFGEGDMEKLASLFAED